MAPLFYILSSETSADSDEALGKFAQFLGLQTQLIPLRGDLAEPPEALLAHAPEGRVLALGRTSLQQLVQRGWFEKLLAETRFIFVYGFATSAGESPELKWLTRGALASVASLEAGQKQFTVHADVEYRSFPVSGKSYTIDSGCMTVFRPAASGAGVETYISANGHPLFVSVKRDSALVFLLSEAELVDIDLALTSESGLRPWYGQLIALAIFLRSALGPWCWTSPVTGATLIVDDPYLKRRYGFVHYETLMHELERTGGALTIAFIPYNHRRSDPKTVALLRRHSDRFSIAVHGCDHTGGEFASLDERWLAGTTACALERMEAHARRTGMPFDNVMVFPQGRFSTKAIHALRACGLAAAVNTTPWPVDVGDNPLTIRDLLQVAVTRYESFPIFVRHYPRVVFDHAFDALFQKPVLVVEHHGFFRPGYEPLTELIQEVSGLSRKVVWMPLGSTVNSSCLLRQTGEGQFQLRHFSPTLRLKIQSATDLLLAIEKPERSGNVEAVIVGGRIVPFEVHSGILKYTTQLPAGRELSVAVLYRESPRMVRSPSWKYRLGASARRMLSDVRDNQLARSKRLLSWAERAKDVVVRMGSRHSLP